MAQARYNRILLKLNGEALAGELGRGIDVPTVESIAAQIKRVRQLEVQVAVVIGAGNIWRGREGLERGMERATADYMGMVATVVNALAMQDALERMGIETRVQTAIEMREVAEPYIRRRAIRELEKGLVVIFGAGTGNPYFTTDTAAALRAMEVDAEAMLKATKVDGVYDQDPVQNPHAHRFEQLTYIDALNMGVQVLDSTALTLCMDNDLPIIVFKLAEANSIERVVCGEPIGTVIQR